jgi:putative ABC transport system permease protein
VGRKRSEFEFDYEKTVGLTFLQGRRFSREFKTDTNAVILNEAALNTIGYKDPIGKLMTVGGQPLHIIGVIKNMLVQDPFKPVNPTVLLFNSQSATNLVFIKLKKTAALKPALERIQSSFEKYNPSSPFDFRFTDAEFEEKFKMEQQVGKLAGIFAALAVFISCLGLFGLAAFMAERRTKEIGIRKVLGATLINIWTLLSKEFVWLVVIGCVIATPLAFLLMNNWLRNYDYRIDISWWVFVVAGLVALVIALLTVSTQALKVGVANPVKSLRSE